MRDSQVYKMQESEQQRFAILYRQVNFLNMRMEAYEAVLVDRWAMIRAILSPSWLKRKVDAAQLVALQEHDKAMREKNEKRKEEEAKPKISIVSPITMKPIAALILAVGLMSGCVSTKAHKKAIQNEKDFCSTAQNQLQSTYDKIVRRYQAEIAAKNKRLKKFNQIDEAGRLRPLQREDGLPMAGEDWMK